MIINTIYEHFNGTSYNIYDAADYIIKSNDIPIYERNIDYTPVVSTFNLTLSATAPFNPGIGDLLYINIGNHYMLSFDVVEVKTKVYKNGKNIDRIYDITLLNRINTLKKTLVFNSTLDSWIKLFATNENYYDNPLNAFNNVQLTWLLQKLFTAYGLSLNISNVYSASLGSYNVYGGTYEIFGKDLCIDYNMFYGLNQNYANAYNLITAGDKTWYDNTTTLLDFVTYTCAAFGWLIYPSSSKDSYSLVTASTAPIPDDSFVYYYTNTVKTNDLENSVVSYKYNAYPVYYLNNKTTLVNVPYIDERPNATFMNSLVYLIRDKRSGAAIGSIGDTGETAYIGINLTHSAPNANHISLRNCFFETGSYFNQEITEIHTEIFTGSFDFKSNHLDVEDRISKLTYVDLLPK